MINDIIKNVLPNFYNSTFINNEIKHILVMFSRQKEYIYLIKPETLRILVRHPSGII